MLLLTQVLPYPPDSGPKVKTWNLLKYIAARHEVTLVSFTRGDQSGDIDRLARYCRAIHTVPMKRGIWREAIALGRSLVSGRPYLMLRDDRSAMRRLVDRIAVEHPPEVVHADQLNMIQYALRVGSARTVFDAHNALWVVCQRLSSTLRRGPRRWLLRREARLLRRYEGGVCRQCDAVLAVSEPDRAALAEAAGGGRFTVLPIAVDVDEIAPLQRASDADRVVHMGTLLWPPNADGIVWFLRHVWPRLRRERPRLQIDVIGSRPPSAVRVLAGAETGVHVHGYVLDPTPLLRRAGAVVVPLRAGGGMRVKILTALAQELPVVSTAIGCEGIDVEANRHLLVADTAEDFARATLRLLEDPQLAAALGAAGRRRVAERYDYRRVYQPLSRLYEGAPVEEVRR